jgi:2-methylcitrate dehydratase PrpD
MSVIGELARFVTGASFQSLPAAERATQRRHVADTLLAAVVGARTTEGRALRQVLPHTEVADACGMLAAVVRHTEIDDIHTRSCTTPSSVTVPTALALARARGGVDADTVASAIWIGTELMTRLGGAIDGARVLYRGLWPTYFTAPLGAAAIAARIGALSEEKTTHALSLALMLSAGRSGRFHGTLPGRSVILAMAVSAGVRAADAAAQGVGGDPSLLDGAWLRDAHGIEARLDALTAGLGKASCYRELSLKPFCSAKQAIAAIEGLTTLLGEGLSADQIAKVRVRVPPPYARMIVTKAEAGARASTIVGAAYQMGLAAHARDRLYDIERSGALDEAAAAFAGKVEIVPDEALLAFFPENFPAEVEIDAGGKIMCKRVTAALGDPSRPLGDAQLADKARRVLGFMPGAPAAADVIATGLAGLDSNAECNRLAQMMWTAVVP